MPNISDAPLENAEYYIAMAREQEYKDVEKCETLCDKALEQLDLIDASHCSNQVGAVAFKEEKGAAAVLCQDYETAIHIYEAAITKIEKTVERGEELAPLGKRSEELKNDPQRQDEYIVISERVKELARQAYTGANKLIHIMLELGKSQKLAGDWEGARDTCKAMIYEDTQSGTNAYPVQILDTCLTICECSYRLGHYEEAIAFGKHAIKMNQPLNWCHKYMALSQKALGQLEDARQTAAGAVIYEAP
jgi:tetratricopeptide (TPR) repeat protein